MYVGTTIYWAWDMDLRLSYTVHRMTGATGMIMLKHKPSLRVTHRSFTPHAVEGVIKSRCGHIYSPLRW